MTDRVIKALPSVIKALLFILAMIVAMAMFVANINQAMAISPKKSVVVTQGNITVGDIFEDIDEKHADFVLAPAPMPDTVLTWDAHTLNRIARAFDIRWRANNTDQVQIRRLANIITKDMIAQSILESLQSENGLQGHYELEFVSGEKEIILPHDIDPIFDVMASSYNASRQTFSATIKTADNRLMDVTGIVHSMIGIPVLKTPVRRGEIITENMVQSISVRADYLKDTFAMSPDDLIGMTPRKILSANTPVDIAELNKPTMVSRGDLVTMQFKKGPIQITAIAKAMESGTKGDIIRLMNMDSKRTLKAQVIGLREAQVYN